MRTFLCLTFFCHISFCHGQQPAPVRTVLQMNSVADWKIAGNKLKAAAVISSSAPELSVTVPQAGEKAWDVCLHSPALAGEIKKGEKIWLSFPAKNLAATGPIPRVTAYLEPTQGKGSKFQLGGSPQATGIHIQETWTADADYAAGSLRLSVHVAQQPQSIAMGPLVVLAYAPETDESKLPVTPLTYEGREPDAPWRAAAAARIKQHRMTPVEVEVLTLAGEKVPDAEITWAQRSHAFGFGCFWGHKLHQKDADSEKYMALFKDNFNYATTPAYLAEWGWIKPEGRLEGLQIADWLRANAIPARGHLLVYPGYVATPNEWRDLPAAERRQRIEAHFAPVLSGLGDRGVTEFDLVNELRDNIGFCDDLGKPTNQTGLQVVADWFKLAKKLSPKAELFINEYWILAGGGLTEKEQTLYEKTIKDLLALGAPLDGIGLQGHFGAGLTPPDRLLEIVDRFAKLGKKLRITEFDIDIGDEQAQADYTRDFYTQLYSHPGVEGIVQWGFWEGQQWKPRAAMLRKDWSPKPSYHAFRKLTKETLASHFQAKSNAQGLWQQHVHQGTHALSVKVGSYTYQADIRVEKTPQRIIVRVP